MSTNSFSQSLPAFPGAEGFGASTTGGRGGRVLYVTTLAPDPAGNTPGSLNWALKQTGPRYILFKVSGVIHATAQVRSGNVTIAGQTSPGGITTRGLVCDYHYAQNDCSNLSIRHLRARPAQYAEIPAGGDANDDALRLDGIRNFIIDHASFAHAVDEVAQISWASNGTIQNTIFAETIGYHAQWGGMLLNYSNESYPQDHLSIHHNLWFRLGGRPPEIGCESSSLSDIPPRSVSDCLAHPLRLELSNNLHFDPAIEVQYGRHVNHEVPSDGVYTVHLNMVGNRFIGRASYGNALFNDALLAEPSNRLFIQGNTINHYPTFSDYQLAYCCNDFPSAAPNTALGVAMRLANRHSFPAIDYHASTQLAAALLPLIGAWPRDPMDTRIVTKAATEQPSNLAHDIPEAWDALNTAFTPETMPAAPLDTDLDGMPDWFETKYLGLGLDPLQNNTNGSQLSLPLLGVSGYDNLEVYLAMLSDQRIQNPIFMNGFE